MNAMQRAVAMRGGDYSMGFEDPGFTPGMPIWETPGASTASTFPTQTSGHSDRDFWGSLAAAGLMTVNSIWGRQPLGQQAAVVQPTYQPMYNGQQPPGVTVSAWQRIAGTIGVSPDMLTLLAIGGVALWALPSFRGRR